MPPSRARARSAPHGPASALDNLPLALPALLRAAKMQRRLARVGFDWPDLGGVIAKIKEELGELESELRGTVDRRRAEDELGDVLFSVANLARKLEIDPEEALRKTNRKVERRFRHVEAALRARGTSPERATLAQMDRLWNDAKHAERTERT